MKICKLKLKNLNSFRESIEIDFEKSPLDDASLVAITGPTGAGKTTLLDAICVALYGKTPRLSGTGNQNSRHLISHGEKEGFAEVLFMVNGTRYLATWVVRQKGAPKVQLFYADNRKLISDKLSTKGKSLGPSQKTVSEEVESILGLDFNAFTRSVMLAQGEFAAFLKADKENRRNILEATAGVHIYDILGAVLNQKVAEVEAAHDEVIDRLKGIPEASHDQLKNAEGELEIRQKEAKRLGEAIQQTQEEKTRETKRTEDFERLQLSKNRQDELLAQQPEIDALRAELENANRAQRLLPEKREFDTVQSACEESKKALRAASAEKTEAETRVGTDKATYDEKMDVYQAASTERDQKIPVYTAAKSDVERAEGQLVEAKKRDPRLADLSVQIDALENRLTDRQTEQTDLQGQIDDAQRFLEDNPLPSDRRPRLTRTSRLLDQLESEEKQLQTELKDKANVEKKVSSLKKEIEKLFKTQEERLSEKAAAETTLEDANTRFNDLLATGTTEEWTDRKQQAARAYPILHGCEETLEDLENISDRASDLSETASTRGAELVQIEAELQEQTEACQHAAKAVERCEEALRSEMLTYPINQLRQHLHTGKPCLVCGATEHPYAGVVEPENEERLQDAKNTLENAKSEMKTAQEQMQALKMRQIKTQQDREYTINQGSEIAAEAKVLQDKAKSLDKQWEQISPDFNRAFDSILEQDVIVSSKQEVKAFSNWIIEQIANADTAIAALRDAEQARTEALHVYEIVSQQLETCENTIRRETNALNDTKTQLVALNNTIADLQAAIASTEERFWESMPETFHGAKPKKAVDQFEDKIESVASREDVLRKAEGDLQVLNANIEADEGTLQNLKNDRETLKNEKNEYLRERDTFLSAARQKTDGLNTEDEIDKAIEALETALQTKEAARDSAEEQFQNSQNVLTEKRTAHQMQEKQYNTAAENLDTSRQAYFNKLEQEGFDTPEAHDNAFRDDDQIQDLSNRIDTHADETQQLALEITELQARFEETPYDPDALGRIETQLSEIETQVQEKLEKIGAKNKEIDDLKDALKKREALAAELDKAEQEMQRWQQLHGIISKQALRDFALEIMFRQMGTLANEQLRYLTSDRYELKVESIGDLTVLDRWNANEERPVQTLSGGESFLTSLALALALSELSSGRAQLNSLFLDEGFGTLDSETLDTAIAALEGLQMQGRNIYLISHVQELTRRLPVKINVRKRGNGSSSIDIRG